MQIEVEAIEEAVTDLHLRNQSCKFRGNQAPGTDAIVQGEAQQGCWGPPGAVPGGVLGLGCPFAHLHAGHRQHPQGETLGEVGNAGNFLQVSRALAGHGAKQSLGTWGTLPPPRTDLGGGGGSPKELSCR